MGRDFFMPIKTLTSGGIAVGFWRNGFGRLAQWLAHLAYTKVIANSLSFPPVDRNGHYLKIKQMTLF